MILFVILLNIFMEKLILEQTEMIRELEMKVNVLFKLKAQEAFLNGDIDYYDQLLLRVKE